VSRPCCSSAASSLICSARLSPGIFIRVKCVAELV
jgi:hypothetical protein